MVLTWGDMAPQGTSGDILVSPGGGGYWHLVPMAAHRCPTAKNHLAPAVPRAEAEKPWLQVTFLHDPGLGRFLPSLAECGQPTAQNQPRATLSY